MKMRNFLGSSVVLSALIVIMSTPSVQAQKFKYKPLPVKGTKPVTVPSVINPRLSRAAQESLTRWSGVAVSRPMSTVNVSRQVAAQVTAHAAAPTMSAPQTPPLQTTPTLDVLKQDFFTGPEALEAFRPGWKSELALAGFTEEQISAVEQAFYETDQFLFELDENGNWIESLASDWEYSSWFSLILTDGPVKFADPQLKTLFGKFSRLDDVFTRLNLQSFMLTHEGRAPKTNAPGKEGNLARKVRYNVDKRDRRKMNPEVEEYAYGKMPAQLKKPVRSYGPKGRAPSRTPDEVYEEVVQFIKDNGRFPSLHAEDPVERSLRVAFDYACKKAEAQNLKDGTSMRLLALKAEHVNDIAAFRTPQEVLEQVEKFMAEHDGRLPSRHAKDPVERSLRQAFDKACRKAEKQTVKDGISIRLLALKAEHVNDIAAFRTPQEVLEQVEQFMAEHDGRLPSLHAEDPVERSLRVAFDYACRKAEKQPVKDGTSIRLLALKAEHVNDRAAPRTPQEILEQVKAYRAAHNGQNPSQSSTDKEVKSLRQAWNNFHQKYKDVPLEEIEDEVARELEKLYRETVGGRN